MDYPPQIVIQALSIVIRGQFTPTIFQPAWLASQNLIRQAEAEAAEITLIHAQATIFKSEWLHFEATEERLQISTSQEAYYEPLRDLVIGIFNLLDHTPLRAIGINHEFHYRMATEQQWHNIGHRLAPKEDWQTILKQPGLTNLEMQGVRDDGYEGYKMVRVAPSTRVEQDFGGRGIFIHINEHYQLSQSPSTTKSTQEMREILGSQWSNTHQQALEIAQKIISLKDKP